MIAWLEHALLAARDMPFPGVWVVAQLLAAGFALASGRSPRTSGSRLQRECSAHLRGASCAERSIASQGETPT